MKKDKWLKYAGIVLGLALAVVIAYLIRPVARTTEFSLNEKDMNWVLIWKDTDGDKIYMDIDKTNEVSRGKMCMVFGKFVPAKGGMHFETVMNNIKMLSDDNDACKRYDHTFYWIALNMDNRKVEMVKKVYRDSKGDMLCRIDLPQETGSEYVDIGPKSIENILLDKVSWERVD